MQECEKGGRKIGDPHAAAPAVVQQVRQSHQQSVTRKLCQVLDEQRQRLVALPLYPEVDDLQLLAFSPRNAGSQGKGTLDVAPGLSRLGALHIPDRQTAIGHCQTVVEGNRVFELGMCTGILGQQPVKAFLPALGSLCMIGADGHTIVIGEGLWHCSTSLTPGHAPYVLPRRDLLSSVMS
jgi:hypothetical protein